MLKGGDGNGIINGFSNTNISIYCSDIFGQYSIGNGDSSSNTRATSTGFSTLDASVGESVSTFLNLASAKALSCRLIGHKEIRINNTTDINLIGENDNNGDITGTLSSDSIFDSSTNSSNGVSSPTLYNTSLGISDTVILNADSTENETDNTGQLVVVAVRESVTPIDWAMDSACKLNLKSKEKGEEGMKRVKIIMLLSIVLLLFGCSQKQPENVQTTSEKSTNITVAEEKTVSEQNQSVADTVKFDGTTQHDSKQPTAKESTALQTTPKATANYSETETYKYVPSDSSDDVFSYVKKGNMFYTDDKKFAAGQNNYRGITLSKHFLRDGVSLNKISVNFTYDEKEWLIISSKGVYGYNLAGGETAVITAPKGTNLSEEEKYCVPSQNDWIKIQIEGFDNENRSLFITDYENHWWANGYIQSDAKSSDEITVKNRIAFKDEAMAELFASELADKGMKAVQSEQDLKSGCYYVKDEEVYYVF